MPLVVHLPAQFCNRQGGCILLASLFGAVFKGVDGGAASASVVSFHSCQLTAIKASCANTLCVAVVIVRVAQVSVVVIGFALLCFL